mgnify:CR=1 FL=1
MDRAHRIGQKKVGYENTGCGVSSLGNQNLMNSQKSEALFDNFLRWNDSDPKKTGAIFTPRNTSEMATSAAIFLRVDQIFV